MSISSGGSATLTWSSTNASSCTASNAWTGNQATSGSQSTGALNTAGSDTYTLTCTGAGGTLSNSATVTVTAAAPAPTVLITANTASVTVGQPASLSWTATNATACTASGAWTGTEPTSGTQFTDTSAAAGTYTYTLTCSGEGETASDSATVTVQAGPTTWIPDYEADVVRVYFGNPSSAPSPVTLALPGECKPNSLAIDTNPAFGARLYIACLGTNEILVYNHAAYNLIKQTTPGMSVSPMLTPQVINDGNFSGLIGMAFDASHDLWVASLNVTEPNGPGAVLMIPAGTSGTGLDSANPTSVAALPASPTCPAGLAFDAAGGLWVTGSLDTPCGNAADPILLHFPVTQLGQGAATMPDYCISPDTGATNCEILGQNGIGTVPGTPQDWEGVSTFDSKIWVSNNGAGAAGDYIYSFNTNGGMLNPDTPLGSGDGPFTCPGAQFATNQHLWINDESYNDTNKSCGNDTSDMMGGTGGVFDITAAIIAAPGTIIPNAVTGYLTGRPGYGGLYVENDD